MSSDQAQNRVKFFNKMTHEAERYALNVLRLNNGGYSHPPHGLLVLNNGLSKPAKQTILANIAGYLLHGPPGPAKCAPGPAAPEAGACCQVTVQEREQLYGFSGKGAKG